MCVYDVLFVCLSFIPISLCISIQGALVETENIIRYRDRNSPVLSKYQVALHCMIHHCAYYHLQGMTVVQVGVQAICNFITGNPIALESIWEDWMQQQDRGTIFR